MNPKYSFIVKRVISLLFIVANAFLCGIGFAVLIGLIFGADNALANTFKIVLIYALPAVVAALMTNIFTKEYARIFKQKDKL